MTENIKKTESTTPQKKQRFFKTDRILSLTAIFVSACTLFILLYQTHLSNKMYHLEERAQKMSVFPYLELGTSYSTPQYYKLLLKNSGIGPAMIKQVKILYKDSVYLTHPADFLYNQIEDTPNFYYAGIHKGRVIPANESLEIIGNGTANDPGIDYLINLFNSDSLNIAIEYTSIYEDKTWVSYLKETPTFPDVSTANTMK